MLLWDTLHRRLLTFFFFPHLHTARLPPTRRNRSESAPRPKSRKRACNVFYDDRGFPDESDEWDHILHNIDGSVILRRLKFPMAELNTDDSTFNYVFNETEHGAQLREYLDVSHLTPSDGAALIALVKKYWCVFDSRGVFTPVRNYQCIIDTGNARPISVKGINYGPHESEYMRTCISALAKVGQISQIHDGGWLFKALLAPGTHFRHQGFCLEVLCELHPSEYGHPHDRVPYPTLR
jgi:hypothetical protein